MKKKYKILIADDNDDILDLLDKRLKAKGYLTIKAKDGREALIFAQEEFPDLIIMNVVMPYIDGYKVVKELKRDDRTCHIPVILLTYRQTLSDRLKSIEVGADGLIEKPFTYRELSAKIEALLKVRELQQKLFEAEKLSALGKMADGIAHELRNPLAVIGGFARRIREKLSDSDPNRKYVDIIIKEVERLEKMVNQVIEFKELSLKNREPSSINEIVKKAVSSLEERLKRKLVKVRLNLSDHLPRVSIDKENMTRSFIHILQNSIDATSEGEITISTDTSDGYIVVNFQDTGVGIPKEHLSYIFDPFFTTKPEGTGLGLTIARKIIEDHGGKIEVESTVGEGTLFSVILPKES